MAGKAVSQGKVGRSSRLGEWLVPVLAVAAVVVVGVATARLGGTAAVRRAAGEALEGGQSAHVAFRQHRHHELELIARIIGTDPLLTSYLTTATEARDRTALLDVVEEYQNLLRFEIAVVLDRDGVVLARTDAPASQGERLDDAPIVAQAKATGRAFGAWRLAATGARSGYRLHHAYATKLVKDFELVGFLVVGFAIDDALALQMKRSTGAETVYLASTPTGPAIAAGTLEAGLADQLVDALRRQGDAVARTLTRGEPVTGEELELGSRRWLIHMTPLADAAGQPAGAAMSLASLDGGLGPLRSVSAALLVSGLVAILLILGWHFLARRMAAAPVEKLASFAEGLRQGRFDGTAPAAGEGAVGRLGAALDGLRQELAQRDALRTWAARARRTVPEDSGRTPAAASAQKTALLVVEMRRFADPRIGYDAEATLGLLARDLRRIDSAITTHGGRLESVSGHRAMALFAGDGASMNALGAATEVLLALSSRDHAFDEVEAPVVALTSGNTVTGPVVVQGQPRPAVAGLPVQQLESLMREATPGEIFLSRAIQTELAPTLAARGVTVRSQRPILGTQPLFVLDPATAQQATGVSVAPVAATGGETRELADLAPGILVGDRFELRAEEGRDWLGAVFEAVDRHRSDVVRLRVFGPEVAGDRNVVAALRQRLQRACTVAHPAVLTSWDEGEADGLVYVVAELVRAARLRVLLEAGPVSQTVAVPILRQVATGLWAAHRSEVVHGALDTDAILVAPAGEVKIADLGAAPRVLPSSALGSAFRAPEQLAGQEGDRRSDVFSLGVLAFQLFAGRLPWGHDPAASRPLAPSLASARPEAAKFGPIVGRCLAADPAARPSLDEVLRDLAGG